MIEALKIPENNDSRAPCLDTLSSLAAAQAAIAQKGEPIIA